MASFFSPIDLEFAANLFFVIITGFLLGYERGSRGEPAGVRTHIIVCMGAMLFTMMSRHIGLEPSRIAANVVVGIGFLGAGLIIQHGDVVHGVTSAANLWLIAAIGVVIGFGYFFIATAAAVATFIVLKLPHVGDRSQFTPTPGERPLNYKKRKKR